MGHEQARLQTFFDVLRNETSKTLRLTKPRTVAETRWGTIFKSLRFLNLWARPVAAAVIHVHGQGTRKALAENAQRVFSRTGYVDQHTCRLPPRPGWMVHTLSNQTDVLFFAFGGFMDAVMNSPMMDALSHNLECSRCSVCGIESFFRRLLHILDGHLFVGKFNSGDSFTGSNAARALATKRGLWFEEYKNVSLFNKKTRQTHTPQASRRKPVAVVKLEVRIICKEQCW